jgi:hypothetical protein
MNFCLQISPVDNVDDDDEVSNLIFVTKSFFTDVVYRKSSISFVIDCRFYL